MTQKKINQALARARNHVPMTCPMCGEMLYAPIEKLSLCLFGYCSADLNDEKKEQQLLDLANQL